MGLAGIGVGGAALSQGADGQRGDLLWQALRGKQLGGIKFRRQQPIGPFVVDFYASSCRVVVEVDGSVHDTQVEADQARQRQLEATGLRILRLTANLVETNLPEALRRIQAFAAQQKTDCRQFAQTSK